jgi:RNA polymerase sigma-70 factor (ECF subfamily)
MSVEGRPLDETALVAGAQNGDISAYAELVRRHQKLALRVAYLVSGSEADAEDITQDAFVKAFASLARFDPARPWTPWLLQIVRNEALNRRRRRGRQARLALRVATDPVSGDAAPSPEAAIVTRDQHARLLAVVDSLPTSQRDVIVCRYFLELSAIETSRALGLAIGTVKSRTSRALVAIRSALGVPGDHDE